MNFKNYLNDTCVVIVVCRIFFIVFGQLVTLGVDYFLWDWSSLNIIAGNVSSVKDIRNKNLNQTLDNICLP